MDLVLDWGGALYLFEIKSSMTITPKFASPLQRAMAGLRQAQQGFLISRDPGTFRLGSEKYKILHRSWTDCLAS